MSLEALAEADRVALPAWVRLHFDRVRDRWVLLAPERVLFPCATSVTIIERLGGGRGVGDLVDGAGRRVRGAARRRSAPTCGRCCRAWPTRASSPWTGRPWRDSLPSAGAIPGPSRRWGCSPSSPIAARCNAPTAPIRWSSSGSTGELATAEWCRVLDEAAELGVLQVHLSGGEPTARRDLEEIVAHARGRSGSTPT